ncbi:hypothetical protein [Stutzerimonas nitrititolerans]|uniref:hypothetical protein n=1 Tax=Stutzerimonas nitrititolerans TaxID=2482751 RepID=UPI00289EB28E|nr:hypothetical protein [Stutzerimonas nitrititolerans]
MKGIRKIQTEFESACDQLLIKRMEMVDLTDRAENAFKRLQQSLDHEVFGRLYFHRHFDDYRNYPVYESRVQGGFQIHSGVRHLGIVSFTEDGKRNLKSHWERGATISFSQSPSGEVMVLLYPYKSKLSSVKEEFIAIGLYSRPSKVTVARLEGLFRRFLKYSMYTSAHYPMSLKSYYYRLWLTYLDARNKKAPVLVKNTERILLFVATVGAFWISLK